MQLTIDSSQPLDDVLRVIGAMYNVDLAEKPAISNGHSNGRRARAANGSKRPVNRRRGAGSARGAKKPTTAEVRAWALSRGYEVGSKGRISDTLVDEYRASQR